MKRSKHFLISIITFLAISASAQQVLTLDECIGNALENNYSIRIVNNRHEIATLNFTRGNAGLLPSLDLRTSFSGNLNNNNQNYADGSTLSSRNIQNTTLFTGVSGDWMIYNGLRGRTKYRQLDELMQLSELNTRITVENMIADIASEYYFFLQQRRLFSNLQYAVNLSRERVRIEKEHFLLGSGSKIRLLQAQVSLNADSSRLEHQHEILVGTRVRLAELMALENLNEEFIPADTNIVIIDDLIFDELLGEVTTTNAVLLAARHSINISQFDLDLTSSQRMPWVSLGSGYGYTRNTFGNGSLKDQSTWGMNYSITAGIPLYDGGNLKRIQKNARIELENSQLTYDQTLQDVTASLITVYTSYSNNLQLLSLETQNMEVARENLDIGFERYRLGGLSGFELREVQKDLLEAEERLLSVQYQAKLAEIRLLLLSGRILEL